MTPDVRATMAQLLECLKVESQKVWDALDKQANYQAQLDRLYAQIEAEMQPEPLAPLQLVTTPLAPLPRSLTAAILGLIGESPDGLTSKAIRLGVSARGYRTSDAVIAATCLRLAQDGRLMRPSRGVYAMRHAGATEASA